MRLLPPFVKLKTRQVTTWLIKSVLSIKPATQVKLRSTFRFSSWDVLNLGVYF